MSEMDEAHRRDYADKEKMRRLRRAIEAFLKDPPARAYPRLLEGLYDSATGLEKIEAQIVWAWS